jgi:hypothetical protein
MRTSAHMPTGGICRAWWSHAGERLIGALGAAYPDR